MTLHWFYFYYHVFRFYHYPFLKFVLLVAFMIFKAFILFLDFIYLFLEKGREREREGEKHQRVVASHMPHTGDLASNPGMCPRLFDSQATLNHSATPARALLNYFNLSLSYSSQIPLPI